MCSSAGSSESGLPNTKESQRAAMRILHPTAAHLAKYSGAIILTIEGVHHRIFMCAKMLFCSSYSAVELWCLNTVVEMDQVWLV